MGPDGAGGRPEFSLPEDFDFDRPRTELVGRLGCLSLCSGLGPVENLNGRAVSDLV